MLLVLVFLTASFAIVTKPTFSSTQVAENNWTPKVSMHQTRSGSGVSNGKPKVGDEVPLAEAKGEIVDLKIGTLLSLQRFVHDIVPVVTFGIAYEARMMAFSVGRQITFEKATHRPKQVGGTRNVCARDVRLGKGWSFLCLCESL